MARSCDWRIRRAFMWLGAEVPHREARRIPDPKSEEAPPRNWAILKFRRGLEVESGQLKDTQFADYHGTAEFGAVFKRDCRAASTGRYRRRRDPRSSRRRSTTSIHPGFGFTASTAISRRRARVTATSTARWPRRSGSIASIAMAPRTVRRCALGRWGRRWRPVCAFAPDGRRCLNGCGESLSAPGLMLTQWEMPRRYVVPRAIQHNEARARSRCAPVAARRGGALFATPGNDKMTCPSRHLSTMSCAGCHPLIQPTGD
jgi:hypothetical protein